MHVSVLGRDWLAPSDDVTALHVLATVSEEGSALQAAARILRQEKGQDKVAGGRYTPSGDQDNVAGGRSGYCDRRKELHQAQDTAVGGWYYKKRQSGYCGRR